MKSIEERAKEYAQDPFLAALERKAYIAGATEQKAIDDAEWLKIKSSWEREAQINHNDENNYKQGFHDAIEESCKWFADYLMEIGYPDDWMRDSPNMKSGEERFRQAMEE